MFASPSDPWGGATTVLWGPFEAAVPGLRGEQPGGAAARAGRGMRHLSGDPGAAAGLCGPRLSGPLTRR
eukprot:275701-Pyramimonas_sp.AAC.1